MAVPLKYVEDGGAGGKGVYAGLLGAWPAECHGAEDDVEGWGFGAGHFGLNLVFSFWDRDLVLSEMCGLSAYGYITHSHRYGKLLVESRDESLVISFVTFAKRSNMPTAFEEPRASLSGPGRPRRADCGSRCAGQRCLDSVWCVMG
jgi:hypothetical protein